MMYLATSFLATKYLLLVYLILIMRCQSILKPSAYLQLLSLSSAASAHDVHWRCAVHRQGLFRMLLRQITQSVQIKMNSRETAAGCQPLCSVI